MPTTTRFVLPTLTPGSTHTLIKHSFGLTNASRSAYLQAATHADEHPGLLVLQHLMDALLVLESQGKLLGRIDVVPYANPIGFGQQVFGQLAGRYDLATGENFNRNFPDLTKVLIQGLENAPVPFNDTRAIKDRFARALAAIHPVDPLGAGKHWLLTQALEHDILLDLHCDTSSILHIYANLNQRERALNFAAATGTRAVFLEDEAGGLPMDEAYAKAWKPFLDQQLITPQQLGFSATLELRGQSDVDDELAAEDARGILRFLQHEGLIEGEEPVLDAASVMVYPLEGVCHLKSPAAGIVAWKKALGESVTRGETIAEIVPLDLQPGAPRTPVISQVTGLLVARHHTKLTRTGQKIGMLAGQDPLPDRQSGKLMGL
ncbi:succinylglutamate desuccinylase/aspartoacylase family protein [Pseudomonas vanderleydeniana]|uniref:Succinylglutamate desuccinylase/aspartoacylase family protein n=1 Tax=Pseudomonas vanderleydeniana TaxID=2745495 RepID=A0A9E6PH18_9PSED|nr:succinylglutamate desuccinylase/aspartoacylase family protein [Pseudomonas vanderleydeniana]QXI26374.1 succinylglutamate desuccinylase/aspartoacylase family protein [Pseudomonas vanderleydeniana]